MTSQGGNVNLLWSVAENDFYVFDHNLAFEQVDNEFLEYHVFRKAAGEVYNLDIFLCHKYELKLQTVLQKWDNYLSTCPAEWLEAEDFSLDLSSIFNTLSDDANGQIWERLR